MVLLIQLLFKEVSSQKVEVVQKMNNMEVKAEGFGIPVGGAVSSTADPIGRLAQMIRAQMLCQNDNPT